MGRVTRAPGRRVRQALAVPVLVLVVAAAWGPATPDAAGPSEGARVLQIQLDVPEGTPVAELAAVVEEVATDPRGWGAHGVVVEVVEAADRRLGLATSAGMAAACAPWGTTGKYGCRTGPVAMVNLGWWTTPPPWWGGDVEGWRRRAVNHEIGHLLGLRGHPPCPGPDRPLPVMALPPRESTPCTPAEWPGDADVVGL